MSSQSIPLRGTAHGENEAGNGDQTALGRPTDPPVDNGKRIREITPFWHDRLIEISLVLSMTAYYVIGNVHLGTGFLFALNPLLSLPFLLVFAVLCWYRLPIAIALLPLTLPFYFYQKTIFSHYSFSLAEITLSICLLVALLQLGLRRRNWSYWLSWPELRDRLGPFAIPIFVFFLAATLSLFVAYDKFSSLLFYREEVIDPLLYLMLALYCLRSRSDVTRLLLAMLGTGLMVALVGMIQFFFFRNTLQLESDGVRRVHAMYGSANSIGLLFDYVLPIGLAWIAAKSLFTMNTWAFWKKKLFAVAVCVPLLYVLFLTQSLGAWIALAVAAVFFPSISIPRPKVLFIALPIFLVALGIALFFFHTCITNFFFHSHFDIHSFSTI